MGMSMDVSMGMSMDRECVHGDAWRTAREYGQGSMAREYGQGRTAPRGYAVRPGSVRPGEYGQGLC